MVTKRTTSLAPSRGRMEMFLFFISSFTSMALTMNTTDIETFLIVVKRQIIERTEYTAKENKEVACVIFAIRRTETSSETTMTCETGDQDSSVVPSIYRIATDEASNLRRLYAIFHTHPYFTSKELTNLQYESPVVRRNFLLIDKFFSFPDLRNTVDLYVKTLQTVNQAFRYHVLGFEDLVERKIEVSVFDVPVFLARLEQTKKNISSFIEATEKSEEQRRQIFEKMIKSGKVTMDDYTKLRNLIVGFTVKWDIPIYVKTYNIK